jgi:inosose dehydratase
MTEHASSSPRPRIAAAPVSWGIFELTTDGGGLPDQAELLRDMAQTGHEGTESGPPGYLGTPAQARALLRDAGLGLAGTFLPYAFTRRDWLASERAHLDGALEILAQAQSPGDNPMVLLSDAYMEPQRMANAGRIEMHPELWLDADGWRILHENVNAAGAICAEAGFGAAFHYHAGSYVETPDEIDRLMEGLDTGVLGLCLDTGHSAFGGGDPLKLVERYGSHISHVHLKDVDAYALEALKREGAGLEQAWERGVFCELGTGGVDLDGCLEQLRAAGFDGWLVIEQDRMLGPGDTMATLRESAARNRRYLRERGL